MIWEMKKRNPDAYNTFMNPNATAAELRSASKAYWGYGHEGGRYSYAEQILEQMKQTGGLVGRQQRGGSVGRISPIMERMKQAQASMEQMVAAVVLILSLVYEDEPPTEISTAAAVSLMPPELPEGPGSAHGI